MKELLKIFIPENPRPEPRHRMANGRAYRSSTANGWIDIIRWAMLPYKPKIPHDGDLKIETIFYFSRIQSAKDKKWKNTKPDADNLYKLIADQLEKIGFIKNDSRFVYVSIKKLYTGLTWNKEGVAITIWKL